MDAFLLAAASADAWLVALAIIIMAGGVVAMARKAPVSTYPAAGDPRTHPEEVVTQHELANLMRKQDEIHKRNEARIASLERTMTTQLHEINRSLGRIEGKIEKL